MVDYTVYIPNFMGISVRDKHDKKNASQVETNDSVPKEKQETSNLIFLTIFITHAIMVI